MDTETLRLRVLLAEDDPEMRWLVARTLRRDGYDVVEVEDGDELYREITMRIVRTGTPDIDLIVTDVRMPGRSGLEIVELLRGADHDVPVILMTAFGEEALRERASSTGAVLLDKPFALPDLRTAAMLLLLAAHDH